MFSSGSRELVTDECPWPLERRIFDPKDTSVTSTAREIAVYKERFPPEPQLRASPSTSLGSFRELAFNSPELRLIPGKTKDQGEAVQCGDFHKKSHGF